LKEWTRERVPLDWAMTQNNLGNALAMLGERQAGTQRLEDAVTAFREALKEWTRERVPLKWAATQNNLGNALQQIAKRKRLPETFCDSLLDRVNAWKVFREGTSRYNADLTENSVVTGLSELKSEFGQQAYDQCLSRHPEIRDFLSHRGQKGN
jgi:hypothetical protein